MLIRSLKPRISAAEAGRTLSGGAVGGLLRAWRRGKLVRVVEFFIPFQLFDVTISNSGREQTQSLALDMVTGELNLYRFDSFPGDGELLQIETANVLASRLGQEVAGQIIIERTRRSVYQRGFFRIRDLRIHAVPASELCVPYWIGLFDKAGRIRIEVVDALRNRQEGGRVRELAQDWLSSVR